MPLFDTSALLPLFNPGHSHHDDAKKAFESCGQVVLHPLVIHEFTTVVRRLAKDRGADGNEEARRGLLALLAEPRVKVRADMDYDAAIDRYIAAPRLSFTDAVVAGSRFHYDKEEPIAFDDHLLKAQALSKEECRKRRLLMEQRISGLDP